MQGPVRRFLGVSDDAEPHLILGIQAGVKSHAEIDRALQAQLARVDRHPDSQGVEADVVRRRLRESAFALKGEPARASIAPVQRAPAPPPQREIEMPRAPIAVQAPPSNGARRSVPVTHQRLDLTAFDRYVLALLVAYGGWNSESRSKLVAFAATHNVSPQGLMKVVSGLGEIARAGHGRFDVSEITAGADRFDQMPSTDVASAPEQWPDSLMPELREGGFWATVKLSLLFGAITLLLGVLFVRILIEPAPAPQPPIAVAPEPAVPTTIDGTPLRQPLQQPAVGRPRLAVYPQLPNFVGDAAPPVAAAAADQSPRLPEQFDELGRKLTVATTPSRPSYQDWVFFNEQAGLSWPLTDRATRSAMVENMLEVIFAVADKPSVIDPLLRDLAAPADSVHEPLDLWRGAWAAGALGAILSRTDMPALVKREAESHFARIAPGVELPRSFSDGARAWLAGRLDRLVSMTAVSDSVYDYWELWIAAQRVAGTAAEYQASVMDVLEAIIQSAADIASPGPMANVLGRMLHEADFEGSAVVRDRTLALFGDTRIDNRDLWALGSLLAQSDAAPWFTDDLVPREDADLEGRQMVYRMIDDNWPSQALRTAAPTEGRAIGIDWKMGARWVAAAQAQIDQLVTLAQPLEHRPERLMERLLYASWVNEAAAALAAQRTPSALDALDRIERGWTPPDDSSTPTGSPSVPGGKPKPPSNSPKPIGPGIPMVPGGGTGSQGQAPVGQQIGVDGAWTEQFRAARADTAKMDLLHALRTSSGGDLGPIDAATIVHEAYRGAPLELRSLAQTIISTHLSRGPNVSLQLLDQFADAPEQESTSAFIARVTANVLPKAGSADWRRLARLSLIRHILFLAGRDESSVDRMARAVADSWATQGQHVTQSPAPSGAIPPPSDAADSLVAAWRNLAQGLLLSDPVPAPLPIIDRRHSTRLTLAEGAIERTVASRVTALELLAFIVVAEQPVKRGEVLSILEQSARERRRATHVLEQALHAELAQTRLWLLRLEVEEEPAAEEGGPAQP